MHGFVWIMYRFCMDYVWIMHGIITIIVILISIMIVIVIVLVIVMVIVIEIVIAMAMQIIIEIVIWPTRPSAGDAVPRRAPGIPRRVFVRPQIRFYKSA